MAYELELRGAEALGLGPVIVPAGVQECRGEEEDLESNDGCRVD